MDDKYPELNRPAIVGDWVYPDGTSTWQIGVYNNSSDFGGTDCPYSFRRVGTDYGRLDMCSGQHLKAAFRIWNEKQLVSATGLLGCHYRG